MATSSLHSLSIRVAISSPLIETDMKGARGVIINITASEDIGLEDVELASSIVAQTAHEDANIIWGVSLDSKLNDEMRMTVIATNFGNIKAGYGKNDDLFKMLDTGSTNEDDGDFTDIMSMFNK